MTAAAIGLVCAVLILAALVMWSYVVEASVRRHPPNPRYCREPRCLRTAGHVGAHVDESGRSWP